MLVIALGVVTILLLQDLIESTLKNFQSISPTLAVALMNNEDTVVIDVREENEFANGHIENAINRPLSKLDKHLQNLQEYKNSPVIVACQTGSRSAPACKKLSKMGFIQVNNLAGGIRSWEENKLPLIKKQEKIVNH
jgi:rhodanese-related sulfurtransferase